MKKCLKEKKFCFTTETLNSAAFKGRWVTLVADNEQKRSQQAKHIIENPLFIEAVNKIRSDLANEWLNSDVKVQNKRENILLL